MRRLDILHLILMVTAAAVAYVIPFELLLLSYAVLGPAHYLTEISWLHDRKFFLPHRSIALILTVMSIAACYFENARFFFILIWFAFVICVMVAGVTSVAGRLVVALIAAGITALALAGGGSGLVVLGTLLPTLVHVCVFTLAFMVLGALRSGSKAQALLVGAYVLAIGLIVAVPPSPSTLIPAFQGVAHRYFGQVAPALGQVFGMPDLTLDARITGLLAFVYTYHYLNWFIKSDVIRWSAIPRLRLALVALASVASTAIYFYDYVLGFSVLLSLSVLHVVLEFPLNSLAFRQLGSIAGQRLGRRSPPPRPALKAGPARRLRA